MKSTGLYIASIIFVVLTLSSLGRAEAGDMREIELTDGSVITGEVVSLSDGVYTVRSASLGTLRIEGSKIQAIRLEGSAPSQSDSGSRVKALEDEMRSDSEIMETIRALQNDPDFQKILQDPEIMKAIQAGDIVTLMNNPQIMKLMDKQSIKDINKKLAR